MNGTDVAAEARIRAQLGQNVANGFAAALFSGLRVVATRERKLAVLIAEIATLCGLSEEEVRGQVAKRASESQESEIGAAYAVAAELWQPTSHSEPLSEQQLAELGDELNRLLRVDRAVLAKRRWRPPQNYKRHGSRN